MPSRRSVIAMGAYLPLLPAFAQAGAVFDIRSFGAKGDGKRPDTRAIQEAINAAAKQGGGTVLLPAGRYLSYSIELKSRVVLMLGAGATIIAGRPGDMGHYDLPEPNPTDRYQDFGHNHWHNSLIWADGAEDIAILGPGLIDGEGLTREGPGAPWSKGAAGDRPLSMGPAPKELVAGYEAQLAAMNGQGNKAIAFKNVRRATLRDFSLYRGGHIAILITGGDGHTLDNLKIDSNRDGIDLDCVSNVHLSNLTVNTPSDDAIVLKSSYALGAFRPTRNVTITNCFVSGYDIGSMLDGSYRSTQYIAPDKDGVTGRIKLGTESAGGFENIAISNCVFERCRGLALEIVDGGKMEDIVVNNITMREITTAPLFVRIGDRRRAPTGAKMATARGISIANIHASNVDPRFAAIIAGLSESPVTDITLSNISLHFRDAPVAATASPLPEAAESYPEPSMFGPTPSWGLFVRHARGVSLNTIELSTARSESRPPVLYDDAGNVAAVGVRYKTAAAPESTAADH
ncbi:polygalacturonase [Rhizomicrobium palustre]|uniref:Polygalacturonase n=1 Tax=Rhizomicrobium palustre TaxID=189966 RepID=A0A846MZU1_9PROT|nr:glycosyl hydrolase family 28-related protein [Rhizomicrobium palustre]NIK89138.1 polygalacturonase [Rhizomicrobium palustre]